MLFVFSLSISTVLLPTTYLPWHPNLEMIPLLRTMRTKVILVSLWDLPILPELIFDSSNYIDLCLNICLVQLSLLSATLPCKTVSSSF